MTEARTWLKEVRIETATASTLRLDLRGAAFPYRPGQYITMGPHQFEELGPEIREREAHRGKPLGPGYFSLSSDGIDPSFLEITLKQNRSGPPALLPSFLMGKAAVGREIVVQGPGGKYGLPEAPPPGITGFLHLCAGSGVAPNRGMIRHALARGWPQRHLLLLQDCAEEDVLFKGEWKDLTARHPTSFRIRHVYSRSGHESVSADLIRREAAGYLDLAGTWAFICGPNSVRPQGPGFVDWLRAELGSVLGFSPDRIRTE